MKQSMRKLSKAAHVKSALMPLFVVAMVGMTGTASANDRDLVATTIPASACAPANHVQAGLVHLDNGSWMFNTGATGGVIFSCPLPLNVYTVSDNTNDNDMTRFRVYYRDSDATLPAAGVTVRLTRRAANGALFFIGNLWNSNTVNTTLHTAQSQPVLHQMTTNSLYSFQVFMQRSNALQNPMFTGIDFPIGTFIP